jgi:hypothetical protein
MSTETIIIIVINKYQLLLLVKSIITEIKITNNK